jgi:cell volume regulation protein A
VPIILATYPLISGLAAGPRLFNVVFFVVLLSAVIQGGALPWIARMLKVEEPPEPQPPLSLEISSLSDVNAEIVDYPIDEHSRAARRSLRDLALPETAVVAMIARGKMLIPPRGSSEILAGDHVFIVVDRESRDPVDRVFARSRGAEQAPLIAEFPLPGSATAGDLLALYDIETGEGAQVTLEELIRRRVPDASLGAIVTVGGVRLRVREMREGRIAIVGLALADEDA